MDWKKEVTKLLKPTGIKINGKNPWDVTVNDDRFYERVLTKGPLGLGESYMDGWWDCERLDEATNRYINARTQDKLKIDVSTISLLLKAKLLNLQSKKRAQKVAKEHYDLGNDLFQAMLDKNMQYSCGYWRSAKNLEDAQIAKMDLICRKLGLKPGMTLLDIGSGWGKLAEYAAKNYGAKVTGVSISKEQINFCNENCSKNTKFLLRDYRDMDGKFDRIVSVGMIEHVGYKNYHQFMKIAHDLLKDDGLFLLHTIGSDVSATTSDPWIAKYIFPNSVTPSAAQLAVASEKFFIMEDWQNFGADYDKTLVAWMKNFDKAWPKLRLESRYDERFYRMWRYYLLTCAGGFRSRNSTQLWQIVFSKTGAKGGYRSIR